MNRPSMTATERAEAREAWKALDEDERAFALGALETEAESCDTESADEHWSAEQREDYRVGARTCRIAAEALRALVDG